MRIEDFIKFAGKYNDNLRSDANHTDQSIISTELATGGDLIDEAAKMKKVLSNYFSLSPKQLFELTRC